MGKSDYIIVGCTLLGKSEGVTGSGALATVTFLVEAGGESILDLYDTRLLDHFGNDLTHMAEDGYFSNV